MLITTIIGIIAALPPLKPLWPDKEDGASTGQGHACPSLLWLNRAKWRLTRLPGGEQPPAENVIFLFEEVLLS